MTYERDSLSDYVEFKQPITFCLGDYRIIFAYGKGNYQLKTDIKGLFQGINRHNVLYLPDFEKNLLSVRAMTHLGALVRLESEKFKIIRKSKVLEIGEIKGKFYIFKTSSVQANNTESNNSDLELWHCRLGHLGHLLLSYCYWNG